MPKHKIKNGQDPEAEHHGVRLDETGLRAAQKRTQISREAGGTVHAFLDHDLDVEPEKEFCQRILEHTSQRLKKFVEIIFFHHKLISFSKNADERVLRQVLF